MADFEGFLPGFKRVARFNGGEGWHTTGRFGGGGGEVMRRVYSEVMHWFRCLIHFPIQIENCALALAGASRVGGCAD